MKPLSLSAVKRQIYHTWRSCIWPAYTSRDATRLLAALVVADTCLDELLRAEGYFGETPAQRLRSAKSSFTEYDRLVAARRLRHRAVHRLAYRLHREQVAGALAAYARACWEHGVLLDDIHLATHPLERALSRASGRLYTFRRRTQRDTNGLFRTEQDGAALALVQAVEASDAVTGAHLRRLAEAAWCFAKHLGLGEDARLALWYGALLHDVGKVGVDAGLLRKPTPLNMDELGFVQQHPLIGERIVRPLALPDTVRLIVRNHHERWDGCGYPDSLTGTDIPYEARVVAVLDAYDAMTVPRPYGRVFAPAEALATLEAGAGLQWDPTIVDAFTQHAVLSIDMKQYERVIGAA
jgi:HD-GYP domain-containing protein (c-di-GMP phosphodiesterase class II)